MPHWLLCSWRGLAILPSRPMGELMRRKCDSVDAYVSRLSTCSQAGKGGIQQRQAVLAIAKRLWRWYAKLAQDKQQSEQLTLHHMRACSWASCVATLAPG